MRLRMIRHVSRLNNTLLLGIAFVAIQASAADSWTPPRTADGQPDLQGTWTNRTLTSFERPESLAGRTTFTDEEIAAQKSAAVEKQDAEETQLFLIKGAEDIVLSNQTSLVIDPPDGRAPVRPEAMAIRGARAAGVTDSYKNIAAWGRCISVGVPGGMFPHGFGTEGMQILQTADQVLIIQEKIHDIRIVPLDGRPHIGPNVRQWTGDSRGHWEGDTLVVETTNFNGRGQIASAPAARRLINVPASKSLHVLERFTLVSEDLLQYEVTVDDPEMFSAPWTLALPWSRNSNFELFEYACHEGNRSIRNMLAVGRARDAAENDPKLAALLDNESRPKEDRARDANRKPLQVLDYLGVEPGMDVLDIMAGGGWYTEVLSLAVGSEGTIVAQNPKWILEMFDGRIDRALDERLANDRLPNVTRLNDNFGNIGPDDGMYDAAVSALNLHDVYYKFGEEITKEFFDAVYSILRPGGVFAIVDHTAGVDTDNAELHRIDMSVPVAFARDAGFIVEENTLLLANPLDSRTQMVFSDAIHGKTDRFILKLSKPVE